MLVRASKRCRKSDSQKVLSIFFLICIASCWVCWVDQTTDLSIMVDYSCTLLVLIIPMTAPFILHIGKRTTFCRHTVTHYLSIPVGSTGTEACVLCRLDIWSGGTAANLPNKLARGLDFSLMFTGNYCTWLFCQWSGSVLWIAYWDRKKDGCWSCWCFQDGPMRYMGALTLRLGPGVCECLQLVRSCLLHFASAAYNIMGLVRAGPWDRLQTARTCSPGLK